MNLGILASHRGTNFQAVIDACVQGKLDAGISVAISNNSDSVALSRAKKAGIPAIHLSSRTNPDDLDQAILDTLRAHAVDLVVTAGYLKKLGNLTLSHYHRKIINIHPSLLPAHGGKGMYGRRIHEAVLANQESETGITVHFVDAEYDTGDIIAQVRIPVSDEETAETLEHKILQQEHQFLIATLNQVINQESPCRTTS